MSSFRLICIAAFTAAMAAFVAETAVAQTAPADQSGKPYLAGLRPPHESAKHAHAKTRDVALHHQAPAKLAQPATKLRPTTTASAKPHRPARLAEKINAHVTWPSVEPPAADESPAPATVLQFTTDDGGQAPVAGARSPSPAPAVAAAKISPPSSPPVSPPEKTAATENRNIIDSAAQPANASTPVQTERFEPPASSQVRVILPAQSETSVTASLAQDHPPRGSSMIAQMLVMLAGAISACAVAWLLIGFGPVRTLRTNVD